MTPPSMNLFYSGLFSQPYYQRQENYSGNIKKSQITNKGINILYYSVVFIKKMTLLLIFIMILQIILQHFVIDISLQNFCIFQNSKVLQIFPNGSYYIRYDLD